MEANQKHLAAVAGKDPLSARSPNAPPSDTDLTYDSPHHTLGYGATQAAPGNKLRELEKRIKALEAAARTKVDPDA